MMYHAESFAQNQYETYIIGNKGSTPILSLLEHPKVHFLYLPSHHELFPRAPFLISAPHKVLRQIVVILNALLYRIPHPPEYIVVQNPPSIPTLALVWLVSVIRGSKVIIDWHNLGFSILALRLGSQHPLVHIAEWIEWYFGRSAYAHLFVTKAMKDFLSEKWNLRGMKIVLYDRPPAHFHRSSVAETHELFCRLTSDAQRSTDQLLNLAFSGVNPPYETPVTKITSSSPSQPSIFDSDVESANTPVATLRPDRPALLLSPTSWTPDEDFNLLMDALNLYEQKAREGKGKLPAIWMVVTGKGPEKDKYMKMAHIFQSGEDRWRYVSVVSMWLEPEDYPLLLGSADLGISLHSSSSGLDLPMKVVDMFGCGLPVCALDFACLKELVKPDINGLVFQNADELADHLESLLAGFPQAPLLQDLQKSLEAEKQNGQWTSWTENWNTVMRPILTHHAPSL
ncbi:beta-1,4-mannosyltransferase [Abortiporus biennis]|nr:beta-1,4-mannosyltransferase [Abortiporus biennis]